MTPRRPSIKQVKNRYSEKSLHVPADFAILASTILALATAGLIVLGLVALAIIVGLVVFRTDGS